MRILYFCPIWGMVPDYVEKVKGDLPKVLEKIKLAGYDGIEMAVPFDDGQKKQIIELLHALDLKLIALQYAASGDSIKDYLSSYTHHIKSANEVKPLFINSHTGKDYFSDEDNHKIINHALALAEELDVTILHETHRGRFSFHAVSAQKYLRAHANLRLVADFSHWCNVSESLLENQEDNVHNAILRTDHIHARVGYNQGCQVNDPRAPEWSAALEAHLIWWDKIVENKSNSSDQLLTITPEFGPPPYMPVTPFEQLPLSSQWDINLWMMNLLKSRYL